MLREALGDPGLRLLVWLPEHGVHADLGGRGARAARRPAGAHGDRASGAARPRSALIVHAERLLERPGLLADVVRAAALPVEVARLRCELRRRLEEVEESRARIVRAGYEERRRLERDLHDGAQQRLVALGMALRRVQRRPGADPGGRARPSTARWTRSAEAVAGLREIARGPAPRRPRRRPRARARRPGAPHARCPSGWTGRRRGCRPRSRPPPTTWSARRVANAVKHADATRVDVRARRRDDGPGA